MLYIKKVSVEDVTREWQISPLSRWITKDNMCYVRCRKDGSVNWSTTSVYTVDELIERNNITLITEKQVKCKE